MPQSLWYRVGDSSGKSRECVYKYWCGRLKVGGGWHGWPAREPDRSSQPDSAPRVLGHAPKRQPRKVHHRDGEAVRRVKKRFLAEFTEHREERETPVAVLPHEAGMTEEAASHGHN